jgi:hypothetical protein
MQITIKRKQGKAWEIISADIRKLTSNDLKQYTGQDVVIEFTEQGRKLYAIGNEALHGNWTQGKAVMSMDSFCDYWCYKQMEIAVDIFAAQEYRAEREAIMAGEGATKEQIKECLDSQPMKYSTQAELFA